MVTFIIIVVLFGSWLYYRLKFDPRSIHYRKEKEKINEIITIFEKTSSEVKACTEGEIHPTLIENVQNLKELVWDFKQSFWHSTTKSQIVIQDAEKFITRYIEYSNY